MKLNIVLSAIFLIYIPITYADTQVATDSQQVCENRINAFKSALEATIDAQRNVDAARAELDKINKLPSTLPPCEKQQQIPALSNNSSSKGMQDTQNK